MSLGRAKFYLKAKAPSIFNRLRLLKSRFVARNMFSSRQLNGWGTSRLLGVMRNDAHRIEKSVYNNRMVDRADYYRNRRDHVLEILEILRRRGQDMSEPTVQWAHMICTHFDDLEESFINRFKSAPAEYLPGRANEFIELVRTRRSTRVWTPQQPSREELVAMARKMIDAARWAPSSGNRQAWRFAILSTPEEKALLEGIKEPHCSNAPLAIFVGMELDAYVYEDTNICMYVDAGMAMMNMISLAHSCGLGTVVNHFGVDLIKSRAFNKQAYVRMVRELQIPETVAPVAIVNIGVPLFLPPAPSRARVQDLIFYDSQTSSGHGIEGDLEAAVAAIVST